jgi:hypothetical protein
MIPNETTRRRLIGGTAALATTLAGVRLARAEGDGDGKTADFLFVQTASGMRFDAATNQLTLTGVSPVTLFFADRPERIAGNMRTAAFVPFWSEGTNSFLSDPPNADVSIIDGESMVQTVVVLKDPVLDGEDLAYTVEVLEGELPETGTEVSVFIDIIGMPLSPVSYAGVRRRTYRRAALYY